MHLNEILLRVNRFKRLRFIGTSAYKLCIHAISLLLFHSPEIRSLYLAGSMASGDIVPGLSDIDIIVVISDMSPEKEYRFLTALEGKLRYLIPPFGKDKIGTHVFVYSVKEWSLLGDLSAGKKFGPPLKLFEKDNIIFSRRYDNQTKGLQHFYKASWRLETIQDNLPSPVKSAFDLRAKQRIMERCLQSVLNGLNEINADALPTHRLTELTKRIVNLQNKSRELNEDSSLNSLLPYILHIFDIAIRNGSRSLTFDINIVDASNKEETERKISTAEHPSAELFNNIFGNSPGGDGSHHELMICNKTYDYFIYDLENREISEYLIRFYAANKKSGLRIMSQELLKRLYLNFPTVSYVFIKFPEKREWIMKGGRDQARLLIDTYSIFPQLRATAKRKSSEAYKSLSNWTLDLIGAWDMERNISALELSEIISVNAECAETGEDEEKAFERFRKLKLMSSVLRDVLCEGSKTQSKSVPC